MKLRHLLILLTGGVLLTGPLSAAAPAGDAPPAEARTVGVEDAARDEREEPAPWRIRHTQHVLRQHFDPDRFRTQRSDHFAVLHNTEPERAAVRAALLDLTHERFYAAFGDFYSLRPAEHPLVCVLFAEQDEFVRYAQRVDRLDMSWSGGYYSSRTNRMVLYDATLDEAMHANSANDSDADDAGERANASRNRAVSSQNAARRNESEANTRLLTAVDEAGASASPPLNLASTTHEAAHQLAFNSGLQRRGVMYPFWVSEGLACAFETNQPTEPFGLGEPNAKRLEDLRRAMEQETVLPLERFVAMTRPPTHDQQQLNTVYAQAWALFQFLYLHEREALANYLRTLADLPAGARTAATLRREFIDAFGPIRALKPRWEAHLLALR